MYHGYKKLRKDYRDFSFHHSFGTTTFNVGDLPVSYSADAHLTMPNQNADGYYFGCTGYCQADLCTDEDKVVYDPADTYLNTPPYNMTEGRDLRDSLKVLLNRGPRTKEGVFGEKRTAFYNIQNSRVLDWFDAIRVALWITQSEHRSSSIGIPWYSEFANLENNILPIPKDFRWSNASGHNPKVGGWTTVNTDGKLIRNGEAFLMIKPWLGETFGDKGWCYMSRVLANTIFNINGTGAFTVTKLTPQSVQTVDMSIINTLVSFIRNLLNKITKVAFNGNYPPIYNIAKVSLGQHLTLDESVSADVGCAEAVSYILKQAGCDIPQRGIAGTYTLLDWLKTNFQMVSSPQAGDVIISATGTSIKGNKTGHTGIVLLYGIGSNDSNSGLFRENYTLDSWQKIFGDKLGFPVYYYRPKNLV